MAPDSVLDNYGKPLCVLNEYMGSLAISEKGKVNHLLTLMLTLARQLKSYDFCDLFFMYKCSSNLCKNATERVGTPKYHDLRVTFDFIPTTLLASRGADNTLQNKHMSPIIVT